ncbi:MAG: 5'/3'-nucleotidase SurE [Chthonomonas sp.]|nr:5'/3'-nucleotidase SurE [Chthonomonas sp.]
MKILITNDDGVHAKGIAVLARVAQRLGDVKIYAPDRERSACGHGMTLRDPLRVRQVNWERVCGYWGEPSRAEAFEVNGIPVDCVNVGLTEGWPECDLVLSGINHGPNLGFDVTYSGTVAGAMEGAINNVRAISLSMALFVEGQPLHLDTAEIWLNEYLPRLVETKLPERTFLNVNIPAIAAPEIQGVKVVGMGQRVYEDRVELRSDPWGRPYYWQGGVVVMDAKAPDTDVHSVSQGYVSVTPITLDWTDRGAMAALADELA